MSIRLVQLKVADALRVALVDDSTLHLLRSEVPTIYELATRALRGGRSLPDSAHDFVGQEALGYDDAYASAGEVRILPPAIN